MRKERSFWAEVFCIWVFVFGAVCFGAPVIEIEPGSLYFSELEGGSNPDAQVLYISNSSTGKLQWEITETCEWLSVGTLSGEALPGETDEVTVSVDITGLAGGEYSCELTITDPDASNSPQYVTVNLIIVDTTLEVPSEYSTIQSAIDVAINDCTIIVDIGTYVENINFSGKNITLTSTNPDNPNIVESTVIDGGRSGSVVTFEGSETEFCILDGFTITGGLCESEPGAGIAGNESKASIKN